MRTGSALGTAQQVSHQAGIARRIVFVRTSRMRRRAAGGIFGVFADLRDLGLGVAPQDHLHATNAKRLLRITERLPPIAITHASITSRPIRCTG